MSPKVAAVSPHPCAPLCSGKVRPGVVWFGEPLPEWEWMRAQRAALDCDLLFSVGTSSLVYPAADLPHLAASRGARIVQVNPQPTSLNKIAKWSLFGAAGVVMPEVIAATWDEASA